MNAPPGTGFTARETLHTALYWHEMLSTDEVNERKVLDWLAWYEASEDNRRAFDELHKLHGMARELFGGPLGLALGAKLASRGWRHWSLWRAQAWLAGCVGNQAVALRVLRQTALACGLVLAAVVVARHAKSWFVTPAVTPAVSVVAPAQQLMTAMTLPDDSRVQLSPKTAVAVAYSATERRLDLSSGEANFVVAHQNKRPFIVHMGALRVRAVGTQFNIYRSGDRVEVTVIEGKIDIYREAINNRGRAEKGAVYHVSAGNRFSTTGTADPGSLTTADAQDSLTWQQGRLHYVHVPLGTVIADLNRYASKPIVIEDQRISAISYTGSVFVDDIDEWLGAIAKEFQLVVVNGPDGIRRISSSR